MNVTPDLCSLHTPGDSRRDLKGWNSITTGTEEEGLRQQDHRQVVGSIHFDLIWSGNNSDNSNSVSPSPIIFPGLRHLGHSAHHLPLEHGFDEWFGAPNCHFGPYNSSDRPNVPVYNNSQMVGRYTHTQPAHTPTLVPSLTQNRKHKNLLSRTLSVFGSAGCSSEWG